MTFSRDGNYIYFVRRDESDHLISTVYRAPILGGTPEQIVKDVDSPITFSPDGRRFAFLRFEGSSKISDLIISGTDGSIDRTLFSKQELNTDSSVPVWSPDGKELLIPVVLPAEGKTTGFLAVDATTGKQQLALLVADLDYHDPVWYPDGSGLIVSATSVSGMFSSRQLGLVAYPQGTYRALTADTNDYARPSISSDAQSLVANEVHGDYALYVGPASTPDSIRAVPLASRAPYSRWDWTTDGRILLPQMPDIRAVKPDGGETVLFSDRASLMDQVAACGSQYFVYRALARTNKASFNLWRADSNGGNRKQLTFGLNEADPECSHNGKWVYFVDFGDSKKVKRISIDGGTPQSVFETAIWAGDISPDDKTLVTIAGVGADNKLVLGLFSVEDKKSVLHSLDARATPPIRFTPDGKGVVYTVREEGVDNLWLQPLDSSPARQLTHFTSETIPTFRYSRDGSRIAIERGHTDSDAVLLRDTSR